MEQSSVVEVRRINSLIGKGQGSRREAILFFSGKLYPVVVYGNKKALTTLTTGRHILSPSKTNIRIEFIGAIFGYLV